MSFFSSAFESLSEVVSGINLAETSAAASSHLSNTFGGNTTSQNDALSGGGHIPSNDPFLNKHINIENQNYHVQSSLAAGGFAVVYKVQNTGSRETLALKRLTVNSENKKSVLQEVTLVKKLSEKTKYVTQYHGSHATQNNEVFLVTELCIGQVGVIYMKPQLAAH